MTEPLGADYNDLTAVSCVQTGTCVAIGDTEVPGVIDQYSEIWDGSSWSLRDMPLSGDVAYSVACPTSMQCIAAIGHAAPRLDGWDGSSWSKMTPGTPLDGFDATLQGVSCPGPSVCIAVGMDFRNSDEHAVPFAESWVGGDWAVQQLPGEGQLTSVSCVTQSACMAVGDGLSTYRYTGLPPAPVSASPPTITGSPRDGSTLIEAHGSWTGSPTAYAYQWQDCDATGAKCSNVYQATSSSYVVGDSDVGRTIRVEEWATGAGGTVGPIASKATVVVVPLLPANKSAPRISGTAIRGQTLAVVNGSWSGSPTQFVDSWQDCDPAGGSCQSIPGATAPAYRLRESDVGHRLRVQEVAVNTGGAGGAVESAATAVVQEPAGLAAPPRDSSTPIVSGSVVAGSTLSTSTGTWTGTGPLSYHYQWLRCASTCTQINGATGSTYKLGGADVGSGIEVVVAARNTASVGFAPSSETGLVQPRASAIRVAIRAILLPTRPRARLEMVEHRNGYRWTFAALGPGILLISWDHRNRAIATSVGTVISRRGSVPVRVRLTRLGRRLLATDRRIELTAEITFTPAGGRPVRTRTRFALLR